MSEAKINFIQNYINGGCVTIKNIQLKQKFDNKNLYHSVANTLLDDMFTIGLRE